MFLFFCCFWPRCVAYGVLVPQPGIKPTPPAVEAQALTPVVKYFNNRKRAFIFAFKRLRLFLCLVHLSLFHSSCHISLSFYSKVYFPLLFNLDLLSFKICHICLMKPQGNDNALYSLETVICLAFYLVIQFCLGEQTCMTFWNFVH